MGKNIIGILYLWYITTGVPSLRTLDCARIHLVLFLEADWRQSSTGTEWGELRCMADWGALPSLHMTACRCCVCQGNTSLIWEITHTHTPPLGVGISTLTVEPLPPLKTDLELKMLPFSTWNQTVGRPSVLPLNLSLHSKYALLCNPTFAEIDVLLF